jgi:hypothetical protein
MTRSAGRMGGRAGRPRFAWLLAAALLTASGCNGDVPPPEEAPPPRPPGVTVTGAPAPPGSELRVFADGFAALAPVEIGFGMPDSDYDVVARSRTDADGRLALMLTVPEWAMVGQRYVVVVAGPDRRRRAVSEPFVVE